MKKNWNLLAATAFFIVAASTPAYAGTWHQDAAGWWYQNDDGTYPANRWEWLDGNQDGIAECYYFNPNGYLLTNTTTPDAFQVDANGAWTVGGVVQTQEAAPPEKTAEVPDHVTADVNGTREPERVIVRDDGTIVRYFNGVPYYTYSKEEETREPEQDVTYGEIDIEELENRILELVNEERVKVGKSELMMNEELRENARVRAEEAFEKFSHIRPDGSNFDTSIVIEHSSSGENIDVGTYLKGHKSERLANDAVNGWLESSKHKRNMLSSNWEETGIGVYIDGNSICTVQLFIKY